MAVIKTERARSKVSFAGFALKDAELSVEMPDIVESLFDELWNCFAGLIWTFCGNEDHGSGFSKRCVVLRSQLLLDENNLNRNPLLELRTSENLGMPYVVYSSKRQFNKAEAVYQYMATQNKDFKGLQAKLSRIKPSYIKLSRIKFCRA